MISPTGSSPARVNLLSAPMEGIRRGVEQASQAATRIASGDVSPANIVSQIQAEILVKANAVSMRIADELLGSLIDIKA
jgi:hypothetical protein